MCVLVAQLCLTLCDPMDCSPPDSSVLGIFQARILEWVAISFSRGSSWPRNRTCISCVSCFEGRFFTHWAIGEVLSHPHLIIRKLSPPSQNIQSLITSHIHCECPNWSLSSMFPRVTNASKCISLLPLPCSMSFSQWPGWLFHPPQTW